MCEDEMAFYTQWPNDETERRHTSYRGPLANGTASVVVDKKSAFLGIAVVAAADLVVVVVCVDGRVDDDDRV